MPVCWQLTYLPTATARLAADGRERGGGEAAELAETRQRRHNMAGKKAASGQPAAGPAAAETPL